MALKTCPECGKEYSELAKAGVHCGAPNADNQVMSRSAWGMTGKVIGSVFLAAFLFLLYGCYLSKTPEGRERSQARVSIDDCERRVARMKDDPRETQASRAFIYQHCVNQRVDYRRKWGRDP